MLYSLAKVRLWHCFDSHILSAYFLPFSTCALWRHPHRRSHLVLDLHPASTTSSNHDTRPYLTTQRIDLRDFYMTDYTRPSLHDGDKITMDAPWQWCSLVYTPLLTAATLPVYHPRPSRIDTYVSVNRIVQPCFGQYTCINAPYAVCEPLADLARPFVLGHGFPIPPPLLLSFSSSETFSLLNFV